MDDLEQCRRCLGSQSALSRRGFVAIASQAVAVLAVTACGGGVDATDRPSEQAVVGPSPRDSSITPLGGSPPVATDTIAVTLASYPTLASVGAVARVNTLPPVALARTQAGLIAYSLTCTHAGSTVAVLPGSTLRCPNHGALFAFDGVWFGGAQQTTDLVRLRLSLNDDQSIATVVLG